MAATELLARFVAAFKRGIEGEVAAMRAGSEAFEIALVRGEDLGALRYRFELTRAEKLAPASVCSLKTPRGDQRVTIERVDDGRVTIVATQYIDVAETCALVVAPWFLYDRLLQALDSITSAPLALTLFGKQPPLRTPTDLRHSHAELNASQRASRRPRLRCRA